MVRRSLLRPVLLFAPDGGLPGVPGSGSSGGSGGLPGIPGSGPSSSQPAPQATPQPDYQQLPPHFSQPTPQIPGDQLTYELSGWWRRVGAAIIDGILIGIIAGILIAIFGGDFATTKSSDGTVHFEMMNGQVVRSFLVGALVVLLYAPTMLVMTKGSTVGKLATGIRVVRADGSDITFGWAAVREVLVKQFLIGILCYALVGFLNYLWPLWDAENRAGHDFIVKSRVVRR